MLRVRMEIVPYGIEARTRPIGDLIISLSVPPHPRFPEIGNYDVRLELAADQPAWPATEFCDGLEFKIHNHRRAAGAFELVRRALVIVERRQKEHAAHAHD